MAAAIMAVLSGSSLTIAISLYVHWNMAVSKWPKCCQITKIWQDHSAIIMGISSGKCCEVFQGVVGSLMMVGSLKPGTRERLLLADFLCCMIFVGRYCQLTKIGQFSPNLAENNRRIFCDCCIVIGRQLCLPWKWKRKMLDIMLTKVQNWCLYDPKHEKCRGHDSKMLFVTIQDTS